MILVWNYKLHTREGLASKYQGVEHISGKIVKFEVHDKKRDRGSCFCFVVLVVSFISSSFGYINLQTLHRVG